MKGISDASVDVVTTRAVLAYVADKTAALREFHRILEPGGRLSIGEPIFRDDAIETIALRKVVDAGQSGAIDSSYRILSLLHRWKSALFADTEEKMA